MRSHGRLGLTLAAGCLVSVGFAWLVLRRMDLQELATGLGQADGRVLLLSLGCQLLGLACLGWRARVLLAPLAPITFGAGTRGQLLGLTVNNLLPLRLGELAKADYFARHASLPRTSTVAAAAAERLLDVLCLAGVLALVGPIALPHFEHRSALALSLGGTAAIGLGAWWLATHPAALGRGIARLAGRRRSLAWLPRAADGFSRGLVALASARSGVRALAASVLYWLATLAGVDLWTRAFGLDLPWYAPAVLVVFLAFGTALPAAPAFIGTWDYFLTLGLTVCGAEPEIAAVVALTAHALAVIPLTVAGGLLLPTELARAARSLRSSQ